MADERWEVVRRLGLRLAILLAMLPVLYVLSVGPVLRFYNQQLMNGELTPEHEERLDRFYRPLEIVYQNGPKPVETALEWYIALWERER